MHLHQVVNLAESILLGVLLCVFGFMVIHLLMDMIIFFHLANKLMKGVMGMKIIKHNLSPKRDNDHESIHPN